MSITLVYVEINTVELVNFVLALFCKLYCPECKDNTTALRLNINSCIKKNIQMYCQILLLTLAENVVYVGVYLNLQCIPECSYSCTYLYGIQGCT